MFKEEKIYRRKQLRDNYVIKYKERRNIYLSKPENR